MHANRGESKEIKVRDQRDNETKLSTTTREECREQRKNK